MTSSIRVRLRGKIRAALAILLLVVVVLMLARLERFLLFFPSKHPEGDWSPAGLGQEDVYFASADGTRLHGWYVPPPPGTTPRGALLYSHGNGGNITYVSDVLRILSQGLRLAVFAYDYRGYGRSEGDPEGAGIVADARAARRTLAAKAGVREDEVILLGRSLGGGVSVRLAGEDGARGLILECTFSSLPDVAAHVYPWLPARWLMRHPFESAALIPRYRRPLFQSHGDRDTLIPLAVGQRLHAAANEPKRFMILPGADHNSFPPQEYWRALDEWLAALP